MVANNSPGPLRPSKCFTEVIEVATSTISPVSAAVAESLESRACCLCPTLPSFNMLTVFFV
jgi:hypothetical protein